MRFTQKEKYEIILLVEGSELGVNRTLKELGISKRTFYNWYGRYREYGFDGLAPKLRSNTSRWNKIPEQVRNDIVKLALETPELSPRELAYRFIENQEYYISESSVYRILKSRGLITSPAYIVMKAADEFKDKTTRPNQMWQTDFTYFKIIGWGWFYLSTILDDYSRFIIHWELCSTMKTDDVTRSLDAAIAKVGLRQDQMPRLLSDNGSCYISQELEEYISDNEMNHVRGRPMHPQTQGKIERYHRSLKNIIKLDNYYMPGELEQKIKEFVEYYNNHRYHESLDNLTPADVFLGRGQKILQRRQQIKLQTIKKRRKEHRLLMRKL